jgi:hypothetical protein
MIKHEASIFKLSDRPHSARLKANVPDVLVNIQTILSCIGLKLFSLIMVASWPIMAS